MLTPEELDRMPEGVLALYLQAEEDILADMARRIAKEARVTDTVLHQRERLKAMGAQYEYVMQTLSSYTGRAQGELRELFERAGEKTLAYDDRIYRAAGLSPGALADSPVLLQLLEAGLSNTGGLFRNLTRTTASAGQQQFIAALDRAWMQISSGGFSYQAAVREAIRSLCASGLSAIRYPTGHVDSLEVAARRAVLTGVSQTTGKIGLQRARELGADLMELTAHAGARPSHAAWQGKKVSLRGERGYLSLSSIGYGSGDGFKGWNCRHDWFPFFPGLSEDALGEKALKALSRRTVPYQGKPIPLYEATQKQRAMERGIRRWKREASALEAAGQDSSQARAKVREWQERIRDYLKETGLQRDYFRERAGKQLRK